MNLMTRGEITRNVVELLIEEYKNAEKPNFINWNFDEDEEDEINDE